jgi:electron-transferring-flavoprotein dehydrogenase
MPAAKAIVENGRVAGVQIGDKGVAKNGEKKPNYQPGAICHAKATVLCEGPRGTLAKQLDPVLGLSVGREPQVYATGVKELWEMPAGRVQKGRVIHTMGWPLSNDTFGGGFIYGHDETRWSVGFVTGLDAHDPTSDPHRNLQRFKTHPLVRRLLEGGKPVSYGAKGDSGGRLLGDAEAVGRRAPALRRHGRLPERRAAQGRPPRDQVGHARGGDAVRVSARG